MADYDEDDELDFAGDNNAEEGSVGATDTNTPPISVMCVALVALLLCAIFGLRVYSFSSPIFLVNQQAVNMCFLMVMSFFYGMVTFRLPETNTFRVYQGLFLPVLLIVSIWLKTYVIYSSNLYVYCTSKGNTKDAVPFRWRALMWNTAKPCIAVLVTYLFITMCPFTLTPFFELFNSAHPLVYFVAVGFWTGCSTWGAEASSYFELQRTGCKPSTNIVFAEVANEFNPLDPETTVNSG